MFWTINPSNYMDIISLFSNVSSKAIPIIRTATGNFLIWDLFDDEYVIMYLDVHLNEYQFHGDTFADLFNYDIISDAVWDDILNGERERMALEVFPILNQDECIVPFPAIVNGGKFHKESLKKLKTKEYLKMIINEN